MNFITLATSHAPGAHLAPRAPRRHAVQPIPQSRLGEFALGSTTGSAPSSRGLQRVQAVQQDQANGSGGAFFKSGREGAERQRLFNTIAPVYDQLNDQLSLGLHRVWKRMAVKWSGARTGQRVLDVCCGSGDLAFRLAEAVGPSGSVVGLDFSANMLADAAQRQEARQARLGPSYSLEWVQVRLSWAGARNVSAFPGTATAAYAGTAHACPAVREQSPSFSACLFTIVLLPQQCALRKLPCACRAMPWTYPSRMPALMPPPWATACATWQTSLQRCGWAASWPRPAPWEGVCCGCTGRQALSLLHVPGA